MSASGALPAQVLATSTATGTAPSPEPTLRPGLDPQDVTPGAVGFLVTLAVVLACIPLFLSMTGKLRRLRHDEQTRAQGGSLDGAGPDAEDRDQGERPEGSSDR